MKVIPTAIEGVVILEPEVFGDARGYFFESFSRRRFEEAVGGLDILPIIHGYTHAIVVDAIQTGEYGPGTVMLMSEHDFDDVIAHAASHDVNLPTAIKIGRQMDPDLMPETIMFVAVEVQDIKTVTETMTPEVEAAVDSAKAAVLHLMDSVRNRNPRCACS